MTDQGQKIVHPDITEQARSGVCGAAWSDFCQRLERVGHQLLSMRDVKTGFDQAETMRYLVGELRVALEWEIQAADPQFPHFFQEETCGSGPAGPNMDNSYFYARVDPASTYRVTIEAGAVFDLIVTAYDTLLTNYGDFSLSDYQVGSDGRLEILVSASPQSGNWLRLPPGANVVGLRVFYYDWDRDRTPAVDIVRLSGSGEAPPRTDEQTMASRLDGAIGFLESRPFRWTPMLNALMDRHGDNEFASVPVAGAGGPIQYGTGRCKVAEDEALIIAFRPPAARYWSVNLYTVPWLSLIDPLHSITGLNGRQARPDADGMIRLVVSHRDPGVANWLATGGHSIFSLWYRWIWSDDHPEVEARLVPFEKVRDRLRADTATVTPEQRSHQIVARRRHLVTRYRF